MGVPLQPVLQAEFTLQIGHAPRSPGSTPHLAASAARRALLLAHHQLLAVPYCVCCPLAHDHGAIQAAGAHGGGVNRCSMIRRGMRQAALTRGPRQQAQLLSSAASSLKPACAPLADALQRVGRICRHTQFVCQALEFDFVGGQHRVGIACKGGLVESACEGRGSHGLGGRDGSHQASSRPPAAAVARKPAPAARTETGGSKALRSAAATCTHLPPARAPG